MRFMRSTHVLTLACTTATLLATGCANSSEAIKLPVQPTAVETTIVPTTAPPTPSTAPPATSATTVIATTVAAPTSAPPTTLDTESQIRAAVQRATQVFVDCQITPETCDFAAYAIPGSPVDVRARQIIDNFLESDLRSKAGAGEYRRSIVRVTNGGTNASVRICDEDSVVLFDIQDPVNPSDDIVFNDATATKESVVSLRLLDNVWKIWEIEQISRFVGELTCAERS